MLELLVGAVAFVLAGIEQIRAQGQSLLAWAVMALALIPLLQAVALR